MYKLIRFHIAIKYILISNNLNKAKFLKILQLFPSTKSHVSHSNAKLDDYDKTRNVVATTTYLL